MLFGLIRTSFASLDLFDSPIPPNEQTLGIGDNHHGVLIHEGYIIGIKLYITNALQMHNFNLLSISNLPKGVL